MAPIQILRTTGLKIILVCGVCCCLWACAKEVKADLLIYENDFESGNSANIVEGAVTTAYNNSTVLGRYNEGGFTLKLDDLPAHELVEISFDLFIHDSWEGNKEGDGKTDGPDMWYMKIDDNNIIETTFSNTDCQWRVECNPQSYPFNYPNNNNNPKTGAFQRDMPGVCVFAGWNQGSSFYKISKRIRHNRSSLSLHCFDKLVQTNSANKLCDESWSIDNLKVRVINL